MSPRAVHQSMTDAERDDVWDHHPDGDVEEVRAVGFEPPGADDEPDGTAGGRGHAAAPNEDREPDDREWDDPPGVSLDDEADDGDNVFGSGDVDRPVEPGSIAAENAVFVALGVALALGAVARLLGVL